MKNGKWQKMHSVMLFRRWVFRSLSMKAMVHSTGRSWTSICRILSEEHGSAVLFSWICRCRRDLILRMYGPDGEKHRPIMIHRVIFGSIERFIGILIEHCAGKFPLWLAPVQVKLLTVTERFAPYAEEVAAKLKEAGLRVETDIRNEKIGYKLREARNERDSYICVIGEREAEAGTLTVRSSKAGELGEMSVEDFTAKLLEEIKTKAM